MKQDFYYFGKKRKRMSKQEKILTFLSNLPDEFKYKSELDSQGNIISKREIDEELYKFYEKDYEKRKRQSYVQKYFDYFKYSVIGQSSNLTSFLVYISDLEFKKRDSKKSFLDLYGNEKVKINEMEKSINSFLLDLKEGKISVKDMNKVLYEFKNKSTKYKKAGSS